MVTMEEKFRLERPNIIDTILEDGTNYEGDAGILAATVAATKNIDNNNLPTTLEEERKRLPVYKHRRTFLYALSSSDKNLPVVIVGGETGSGKSTQLSQYLLEAGHPGVIVCTQPRRVAAITVAQRVAEEVGGVVGDVVGFAVRFEEQTSPATRIKYVTDGVLLREAMRDPLLRQYSVIMIDEAHERTLAADILLALLKKVLRRRPELKVVIMSATLNVKAFRDYFTVPERPSPIIISVQGRLHTVEVFYWQPSIQEEGEENLSLVETTYNAIIKVHEAELSGDVLVFLPGKEEITRLQTVLCHPSMLVVGLYGGGASSLDEQMRAFQTPPPGIRKIVLATNVAETSVTIPGIVYVIDTGLVKQRVYNPHTGYSALLTTTISRASARQRAGRAGRVCPGRCFRLYSEAAYQELFTEHSLPEILKSDLIPVVLQLKALGIEKVASFDFLSTPAPQYWAKALEYLYAVRAIDDVDGGVHLTREVGLAMAELPLEPMLARALLSAPSYGCVAEAVMVAAMLNAQPIFIPLGKSASLEEAQRRLCVQEGDLISMVNLLSQFHRTAPSQRSTWCRRHGLVQQSLLRAERLRLVLLGYLQKLGISAVDERDWGQLRDAECLIKCLATGFFPNVAQQVGPDGSYRGVRNNDGPPLFIHPSSCLFRSSPLPSWVMYVEVVETGKRYMRGVTTVEPFWLADVAPNYYEFDCR